LTVIVVIAFPHKRRRGLNGTRIRQFLGDGGAGA
jgi:hypothetical protein